MKGERLIEDYLRDILNAMDKAEEFIGGMDLNAFSKDDKSAFAVVRSLEIIGEAAKKIPATYRRRYTGIPWKSLAGMRDKLIHDYVGVSLEVVWRTVKEEIPVVRPMLIDMLQKIQERE